MIKGDSQSAKLPLGKSQFQTTHWSVVLAAGRSDSPRQSEALEKLCQTCWYPLYAHVRQRGHGPEDAQDLNAQVNAFVQRCRTLEAQCLTDLNSAAPTLTSYEDIEGVFVTLKNEAAKGLGM